MLVKVLNTIYSAISAVGYAQASLRWSLRKTRQAGQTHLLFATAAGFILQWSAFGYGVTHPTKVYQLFVGSARADTLTLPVLPDHPVKGELAHIKAGLHEVNPNLSKHRTPVYRNPAPSELADVTTSWLATLEVNPRPSDDPEVAGDNEDHLSQ